MQGDKTNTLKNIINFLSFTAGGSTFSFPVSKYMFSTISPPILDRSFSDISFKSFFGGNLPPGGGSSQVTYYQLYTDSKIATTTHFQAKVKALG